MNKILLIITVIIINNCAFSNQKINIKVDKKQVYQVDIANKKYYLIPVNDDAWLGVQPDRRNPIACNGTLLCYKCCTAHNSVTQEFCEYQYQNWSRGKECGCKD